MDNQTDVSIKFKNSVTGQKKLEEYAKTLTTIKSVLGGIDKGAAQQIEQSSKSIKETDSDMKQMSKNFNLAFNYTALRTFARGLSKVVESFSSMTAKSTAFLEDFNLFQVAFKGNYTEATKFVNKLSEMYGLDEDWLVKTTAQFKQLSNAMGLANETGEKVSKLMTQMSIDISSLYNIDVDRATSILQSAMAGQTKPVRALGADITQASLQQTLDRLDISRQVSQLSYAEKRLLIMISLTQQLSGVTNDWGRTLESPSNQIRIMNEQWQRLQRNVGNIFMQIVGKVLPYLNAVLMVLNEIAKVIASLFGYKLSDYDYFDEMSLGVENFSDELDTAAESVEKLKHGLRGFDKLNVITTPSDSGANAGAGGISPQLLNAFNDAFDLYSQKLTDVEMKATKIRDRIMEWLGFTKKTDEETGEVSFKFEHITGGTVLGALVVGGVIYKGILSIYKLLKKIGILKFPGITKITDLFTKTGFAKATGNITKLTKGFTELAGALGLTAPELAIIIGAFVVIAGVAVHAYNNIEDFREKVNTALENVGKLWETIYKKIEPIINLFSTIFSEQLSQGWKNAELVLGLMYDGIVGSFSAIADVVGGTAEIITDIINGDYEEAFEDLKHLVHNLKEDWDKYWEKIGKRFDEWKDELKTKIDEWIKKIKKKIDELPEKLDELPGKAGEAIGKMWKAINDKIMEIDWSFLGEYILNKIIKGLTDFYKLMMIPAKWGQSLIDEVKRQDWTWQDIGGYILDGIINGMKNNLFYKINNWAIEFGRGIAKGLGIASPSKLMLKMKIGDFTLEGITEGMERQLPQLEEQAKNIAYTLRNGIQDASIDANYNYNIPQLNANSLLGDVAASSLINSNQATKQSINPTIIVQVGDKELAKQVITNLQDMAKDNGKPITIGG